MHFGGFDGIDELLQEELAGLLAEASVEEKKLLEGFLSRSRRMRTTRRPVCMRLRAR